MKCDSVIKNLALLPPKEPGIIVEIIIASFGLLGFMNTGENQNREGPLTRHIRALKTGVQSRLISFF